MSEPTRYQREATSWAAGTITARGCKLHAAEGGAWDVEMPDGSWRAASDWRELCDIATEAIAIWQRSPEPSEVLCLCEA